MTQHYDKDEMSEMAEIYKDKLEESLIEEGFPKTISFENEDGDVITYIREDKYDDWYDEGYE